MKMGETRKVAERIVLDRRAYGVLSEPGEERKKYIENLVQKGLSEPGVTIDDEPVIRRKATFLADKNRIEKDNKISFGVVPFIVSGNTYEPSKVYYNAELDKFQIYNGPQVDPPFEDIDITR